MSTAPKCQLVSVEDYLTGEPTSPIKHEYVDGFVRAMAGARVVHNRIASNTGGALYSRLHDKECEAFNSDMMVRIRFGSHIRFYYPDASVICRSNQDTDVFQDEPVVIVEVLSNSTRRIDEGEKKDAYLTIPSLAVYVMIEQGTAAVTAFRRTENGFVREFYEGIDAVLPLGEIGTDLPLAEIYAKVAFTAESPEDEDS